ncbi:ImmA/IrrE family metallo-endopeptidase [Rhizobium deserti]|uniref:ImmA/IrrE family metallo-endopeptidase n=1 Tax=Rhizobium deserti TaxID=2547961 RepID=A0A4R5ULA4_9HYPH|nr:ImmA/IrrE family metallo-endopeptidase [Rhizobium deserti]TDK38595.1 ImmA/IrrE family metallo-endopeptidase [Rhizobium deserti]
MGADWKKAKQKAADVVKNYGLTKPPVDPEAIAEAMGVDVVYAHFSPGIKDKVSGFIQFDPLQIVVNKEIHPNRMTFTIAHELAHFLMHKPYAESNDYRVMPRQNEYSVRKPPEEQEADCFAAELLVPEKMLKAYKDFASTRELARIFAVSEDVILNRLKSLRVS